MLQQLIQRITPLTLAIIGTLVLSFGIILIVAITYKRIAITEELLIILILAAVLTIIIGVFMMLLTVIMSFM